LNGLFGHFPVLQKSFYCSLIFIKTSPYLAPQPTSLSIFSEQGQGR
jgi:hypothetical protein